MRRGCARWLAVLPVLRDHPGIGFVLVRSERRGAMVIGADGVNYLDEERVEGRDPLAPFGVNAARHVKRTDGFPHCPDIVVNSTFWDSITMRVQRDKMLTVTAAARAVFFAATQEGEGVLNEIVLQPESHQL